MALIGYDGLQRRLHAVGGPQVGPMVLKRLGASAKGEAKLLTVPFRKTGHLGQSIDFRVEGSTRAVVYAAVNYAAYVEHGTGLYGPAHRKIVPVHAKVLAWRTGAVRLSGRSRTKGGREQAGWAFARSVRGRKATPFLLPGARRAVEKGGLAKVIVAEWNDAA